jgi:hypothetical protein
MDQIGPETEVLAEQRIPEKCVGLKSVTSSESQIAVADRSSSSAEGR